MDDEDGSDGRERGKSMHFHDYMYISTALMPNLLKDGSFLEFDRLIVHILLEPPLLL